jgi:phosphatidylinositol glycan class M
MGSISRISRHPVFAFVPQMVATIVSGFILSWRYDQEFAWFIQTVVFVTFNKVCTSQVSDLGLPARLDGVILMSSPSPNVEQYFLWYLFFLPIILPRLNISRTRGLTLLAAWIGGQVSGVCSWPETC